MNERRGDDEAVNRLLAGDRVDPELFDALTDLRAAFTRPVPEAVAADHLARLRAAHPHRGNRGQRLALALAAGAGFLMLSGGLASADMLPAPVQDAYAAMVAPLGIDLPDSSDDADRGGSDGSDADEPGQSEDAPGRGGSGPGNSEQTPAVTAPGQTDDNPSVTAPGQTDDNPSVTAPGQTDDNPSVTAPGQTDDNPSVTAPGQTDDNPSVTAPGQTDDNPSVTAPGSSGGGGSGKPDK